MSTRATEGSKKPAFCKIMVGDFTNSVRIPPEFVRCVYKGNVPEVLALEPELGEAMIVETEKRNQDWFLGYGWTDFVMEQDLQHGDFLHFSMIDRSSFEVFLLGKNCCSKKLKEYPRMDFSDAESTVEKVGEFSKATGQGSKRAKKQKELVMPETELPSFEATLADYGRYELCVPKKFTELTGLKSKTEVVLQDSDGWMWPVKLLYERLVDRIRLASGWVHFYKDHQLKQGDTLLFEIVPGTGNVIRVQVLSRA